MDNQINYGTVLGIPVVSILSETTIAKVEKQSYTTTDSTTTTNTTTNYSYYGVRQDINVTTKTNSIPHFSTTIYLSNGTVLSYSYDVKAMEGWHVRQHIISVNNQQENVFTLITETGKFLGPKVDVCGILRRFFSLKEPHFWAKHSNHKISLLLSIPCLFYLLHFAFPKFFDFELNWFIKGISIGIWSLLSIILTIYEMKINKRAYEVEYLRYRNEVAMSNIEKKQLEAELNPIIIQAVKINSIFIKHGFHGLQTL